MKGILRYLKPFSAMMLGGFLIKTIGTLIELALPYILSHILKNVVVTADLKNIIIWGVAMIICALLSAYLNIIANRRASLVARNFAENIRHDLFNKIMRLSSAQIDKFTIPSLESRITSDTYNIHHFAGIAQRMGVRAPILLIGGIIITLIMDSYLALAMIAVLPFIFISVYFVSKKGIPLYTKVQSAVDRMIRVVREDVQGIRVIKALSKADYEHKRYDKVNKALSQDERKAGITMGMINPIMTFLMNFGIVAVIALSANRIANHQSDPETVIAFMQYFTLISMAMMTVTRIFVMYSKSAASAGRIMEVIETEEDLSVCTKDACPDIDDGNHIVFDNVSFSYNKKQNDVENISFKIKKGGSLGIIGATGSGKSTIIKLLMRFYDTSSGDIFINGENIKTIENDRLHSMFGVALQNDFLYSDTIKENILFGRSATEAEIKRAASVAQAEEFITAFPDGYEHILAQKGTNISGGQKQRLLIARAVLNSPEILILDDSSSALDYKTDANLRKALKDSLKNTTVITVAQRVSSVKDSDTVIVIEEGKIIGAGTHEELLINCPEYKEISDSQMGGAIID